MVKLGVETDEVIDLVELDERCDIALELVDEVRVGRVDERDLLVADKVGVVTRAEARVEAIKSRRL